LSGCGGGVPVPGAVDDEEQPDAAIAAAKSQQTRMQTSVVGWKDDRAMCRGCASQTAPTAPAIAPLPVSAGADNH